MNKERNYLEITEVKKITEAVAKVSKHPEQDVLLLQLMWETGWKERVAVTLKPVSVAEPDTLNMYTKPTKISLSLMGSLQAFIQKNNIDHCGLIFGSPKNKELPCGEKYIYRLVTTAATAAGVFRDGKPAWPRLLRHSHEIWLGDIAKKLATTGIFDR